MKLILTILFFSLSLPVVAGDVDDLHQEKASDFFKNAHKRKRNMLKILQEQKAREGDLGIELEGEFGILNTSGNTDTSVVKLALDARHQMKDWSNDYYMQVLRRSSEINGNKLDTQRIQISGEFDYKLNSEKNRLFVYGEYDDNEFLQLRDQLTGVVGWRHIVWDDEDRRFQYSLGPGYAYSKQEESGLVQKGTIVRGTAAFTLTFENDARFKQNVSAEISEMNTRARSITSVSANLFEQLGLKFSFEMTLDENVASNVEEFSTQTSISLVYQFF